LKYRRAIIVIVVIRCSNINISFTFNDIFIIMFRTFFQTQKEWIIISLRPSILYQLPSKLYRHIVLWIVIISYRNIQSFKFLFPFKINSHVWSNWIYFFNQNIINKNYFLSWVGSTINIVGHTTYIKDNVVQFNLIFKSYNRIVNTYMIIISLE